MGGYDLFLRILLLAGLLVPVWTDLKEKRLSNEYLLFLFWTGLFLAAAGCAGQGASSLAGAAAGFFAGGGTGFSCRLLTRRGIGAGDVKLLAVAGIYLGAVGILEVFAGAMLLAGGVCIAGLVTGRTAPGQKIPLAPFVWLAVLFSGGRRIFL